MKTVIITESSRGHKLQKPLTLAVPEAQNAADQKLQKYIIDSFVSKMPSLAQFTFENTTIINLAKHLLRHRTGSHATLYQYVYGIYRFSKWLNTQPDQLVKNCLDQDGDPKPKALAQTSRLLDDFVANLQAEDLAPGSVSNHVKGAKALFRCNGLKLELPYNLPKRSVYEDRAPAPEELQLLDIGDLRERVIITMLALGGFRIGTLVKLEYRHIKRDLEKGALPIHVHVEAEITKGKYHDYDTFIGQEAADYLRAYLESRRKGSPRGRTPPENIRDDSPLIRDGHSRHTRTITTGRLHGLIHNLYIEAGLLTSNPRGRRYDLRAHSIRKFFRTQMASLGVDRDYIEYMMGHTISTYHDIKMKGTEYLRGIYLASGLSIRPKTRVSKLDALKEIIRAWGLNPEEILTRDALREPHRTVIDRSNLENHQLSQLTSALKQQMLKEIQENNPKNSIKSSSGLSSPGEIRTLVGGSKAHYAWPLHHRAASCCKVLRLFFS
jgi:site-specific recombinase XerD